MEPEAQGGGRGGEVHGAAVDEHLPGVGVLRALGQERGPGDTSQTCQTSYTLSSHSAENRNTAMSTCIELECWNPVQYIVTILSVSAHDALKLY